MQLPRLPYRNDSLFSLACFIMFFVPLIFYPAVYDPYEGVKMVFFSVAFGIFLLALILRRSQLMYPPVIFWLLVSFWGWSIISALFGLDPIYSLLGHELRMTSSIYFYLLWSLWILGIIQVLTRAKSQFVLQLLFLSGLIGALMMVLQSFGVSYYGGIEPGTRVGVPGLLGNQNFSAMYLVGILPLGFLLFQQSTSKVKRYWYLFSIVMIIWAVTLASSRGALLGILAQLIGLLVYYFYTKAKSLVVVALLGLIATASLGYFIYNSTRPELLTQSLAASDSSSLGRVLVWSTYSKIILDNPLTGVGPANFLQAYNLEVPPAFTKMQIFDDAHNIFLHLGVALGFPGVIIFILFLSIAIWWAYKRYKQSNNSYYPIVTLALLGLIVTMSFNPTVIACWVLLGTLIALLTFESVRSVDFKTVGKIALGLAGVIFILAGLVFLLNNIFDQKAVGYYYSGDMVKAEYWGSLSHKIYPNKISTLQYLTAAKILNGRDPSGIDLLMNEIEHWRKFDGNNYINLSTLSVLRYYSTSDKKYIADAFRYMDTAKQLAPSFKLVVDRDAYLHFLFDTPERAKEKINAAIIVDPENYYSWILLAKNSEQLKDRHMFLYALERAKVLKPAGYIHRVYNEALKNETWDNVYFPVQFPAINL